MSLSCFWCGASLLGPSPCHCPHGAVGPAQPLLLFGSSSQSKTGAGTELGHGGSFKQQNFGQQEAHTQLPTWNGCCPPPSLKELFLSLVGPQSCWWGPLCSHQIPQASVNQSILHLCALPCPPCAAVAEPWPRGDKSSVFFQLKEPNVFSCQCLVQPNMQCLHSNLEEASGDAAK